jgi:dCMP deaminase
MSSGGIVSTGYNGSPSGEADCFDVGCAMTHSTHDGLDHCVRTIHAEMNAILWAARTGANVYGCTLYVTRRPCDYCAKHIAQAGIVRIVVKGDK